MSVYNLRRSGGSQGKSPLCSALNIPVNPVLSLTPLHPGTALYSVGEGKEPTNGRLNDDAP